MELQTVPHKRSSIFIQPPHGNRWEDIDPSFDYKFLASIQPWIVPEFADNYFNVFQLCAFMREKRVETEDILLSNIPDKQESGFFLASNPNVEETLTKILERFEKQISQAYEFIQTKEFELFDKLKEFFIRFHAINYKMSQDPSFKTMSYWLLFTYDEYANE